MKTWVMGVCCTTNKTRSHFFRPLQVKGFLPPVLAQQGLHVFACTYTVKESLESREQPQKPRLSSSRAHSFIVHREIPRVGLGAYL